MEWNTLNLICETGNGKANEDFYNVDPYFFDNNQQNLDSCLFEEVVEINNDYLPSGHSSDSGNYSPTTSASFEIASTQQLPFNYRANGDNILFADLSSHAPQLNITSKPEGHEEIYYNEFTSNISSQIMDKHGGLCQNFDDNNTITSTQSNAPFISSSQSFIANTSPIINSGEKQLLTLLNFNNSHCLNAQNENVSSIHNKIRQNSQKNSFHTSHPKPHCATTYFRPVNFNTQKTSNSSSLSIIPTSCSFRPISHLKQKSLDNEFLKKKEDRKMRNRESAQLSRQRKKEEQNKMKIDLEQANRKIKFLTEENKNLRMKIVGLEVENKKLKFNHVQDLADRPVTNDTFLSNPAGHSKSLALKCFCIFILVGWMIFPSPEYNNSNNQKLLSTRKIQSEKMTYNTQNFYGRSLIPPVNTTVFNKILPINISTNANNSLIGCGSNKLYNETLNIKLSEDLSTWILRHEKMDRRKLFPLIDTTFGRGIPYLWPKLRIDNTKFQAATNSKDHQTLKIQTNKRINGNKKRYRQSNIKQNREAGFRQKSVRTLRSIITMIDDTNNNRYQHVERTKTTDSDSNNNNNGRKYDKWTSDINKIPATQHMVQLVRDNDRNNQDNNTLYVIALHDYFLLPPTTNHSNGTKSKPPKLSIILPALSPPHNSSSALLNQRSMIRIECEVIDMDVFYLPETLVKFLTNVHQQ